MKNRIQNEINDIRQLFTEFKEIKHKCVSMMKQYNLPQTPLNNFKELEQMFLVDLNLLGMEHLTDRKNKLMDAIDDIMKIESNLKLRVLKQNRGKAEFTFQSTKQPSSNSKPNPPKKTSAIIPAAETPVIVPLARASQFSATATFQIPQSRNSSISNTGKSVNSGSLGENSNNNNNNAAKLQVTTTNGSVLKPNPVVPAQIAKRGSARKQESNTKQPYKSAKLQWQSEEQVVQSLKTELTFDHEQLLTTWARNKPNSNETLDEKIDRVSRIVGSLKGTVRNIWTKQRKSTCVINMLQHPEMTKILEQIQQYKMRNEDLESHNRQLGLDNKMLKKQLQTIQKKGLAFGSINTMKEAVLLETPEFRVVKQLKNPVPTRKRSSSHDESKQYKVIEQETQDYDRLLRHIFTLQQELSHRISCTYLPITEPNPKHLNNKNLNSFIPPLKISTIPSSTSIYESPSKITMIKSKTTLQAEPRTVSPPSPDTDRKYEDSVTSSTQGKQRQTPSATELNQVSQKLSQIRKQRKKIFEDDDLWNNVENMKL